MGQNGHTVASQGSENHFGRLRDEGDPVSSNAAGEGLGSNAPRMADWW